MQTALISNWSGMEYGDVSGNVCYNRTVFILTKVVCSMSNPPKTPTALGSTSRVRNYREKLKASGRQRLEISLTEPVYAALQSLATFEGTSVAAIAEALVTGYGLPAMAKELPRQTETRALVQAALKPIPASPMAVFLAKRALTTRAFSKTDTKEE